MSHSDGGETSNRVFKSRPQPSSPENKILHAMLMLSVFALVHLCSVAKLEKAMDSLIAETKLRVGYQEQ